jgi:pyrimidine and pyridine-specific 5'-nucleotidase
LSVTAEDALMLHQQYYKDYGLAIEGLAKFHKIDPLVFNREVDDALPLDDILSSDPDLRALLEAFDKAKVKLWLFTNAYITHGKRVAKLLGVGEPDTYLYGLTQLLIYNPRGLLRRPDLL